MNWSYEVTTQPTILPVTLSNALAYLGVPATVSTTLSGAVSADDTTINVVDASSLSAGQTIAIGDEVGVISSIATNAITLVSGIAANVASGSPVTYSPSHQSVLDHLKSATQMVEDYLGRALITQTIKYQSDCFPNATGGYFLLSRNNYFRTNYFVLPRPKLQSVTSLSYYTTANVLTVFSSDKYYLDTMSEPSRIVLNDGEIWATDARRVAGIEIIYIAGYGSLRTDVPNAIRDAIKMQLANLSVSDSTKGLDVRRVEFGTAKLELSPNSTSGGIATNVKNLLDASGYRVVHV